MAYVIQQGIPSRTDLVFAEQMDIAAAKTVLEVFVEGRGMEHGLIALLLGLPTIPETPCSWNLG
jgi:hypothetical protein